MNMIATIVPAYSRPLYATPVPLKGELAAAGSTSSSNPKLQSQRTPTIALLTGRLRSG